MCMVCISETVAATAAALTGWRYYHHQVVTFVVRLLSYSLG